MTVPKFETTIPTRGPQGNIFAILANATSMMRQLRVPPGEIEALRSRVMGAGSYDEACAAVREWFPLEGDER